MIPAGLTSQVPGWQSSRGMGQEEQLGRGRRAQAGGPWDHRGGARGHQSPGPGEAWLHTLPLGWRTLGWALPLGTPIQPAPARPASHRQQDSPYKIRAHGASLASRPGDRVWPVWGRWGRSTVWPAAAYRPSLPTTQKFLSLGDDRRPPWPPEDANGAGSSWVHPSSHGSHSHPEAQALISRGLCLPIRRTWMRMLEGREVGGGRPGTTGPASTYAQPELQSRAGP